MAASALEAWHWRLYSKAQALQLAASGSDAVVVDNPYELDGTSATTYFGLFIACCAAATFWALFVAVPCLLASRRLFASTIASHIVAAAAVCIFSGMAFSLALGLKPYISPMITFAVGGAIGLISAVLLAKLLPLNTSQERTRGE